MVEMVASLRSSIRRVLEPEILLHCQKYFEVVDFWWGAALVSSINLARWHVDQFEVGPRDCCPAAAGV